MVRRGDAAVLVLVRRAATTLRTMRERWRACDKIEARGMALLCDWLSTEQLSQFERRKVFDVIGSDSGKRYRICFGTSTNVYELDRWGRIVVGWCFRPDGSLVAGDVMLTQKIALETSEREALRVAKPFPTSVPPRCGYFRQTG